MRRCLALRGRVGRKSGEIWISAVLYILIAVVIIVMVLEAGVPILNKIKDRSAFTKIKETMVNLDQHVSDIAGEGQGSQRVVPVEVLKGELNVEADKLRWKLETENKVVEPRSRIDLGNVIITSDVDVNAVAYGSSFVVENSRVLFNFSAVGSETNWTSINTSGIINYAYFKDTSARTAGAFTFSVGNNGSSTAGTGYTKLLNPGLGLESSVVLAHVNSSSFEYDLELALHSKADFLQAELKNVVVK